MIGHRRIAVAGGLVLLAAVVNPAAAQPGPGQTERVSVTSEGVQGNSASYVSTVTPDGRYVAFYSEARNLVSDDTNNDYDVFVHDREEGTTERVSVASDGTEGNDRSQAHAISADGRFVAFDSFASNLVPDDANGVYDVFVHDRETGVTERVSVASDGAEANSGSLNPSVSADGRYVAFASAASNLVAGDTNGVADVFVHDRESGTTERVSVGDGGGQTNASSTSPRLSADGRVIAFASLASNLAPGDTNGEWDVFVRDLETGVTERVSVASDGAEGDENSLEPSLSADGRYVAFRSDASTLVPGDANGAGDVFVHDREAGTTQRVSVGFDGAEGDGLSHSPSLSGDGRYVTFGSYAVNLVPGGTVGPHGVFVHDRETGATEVVSVASDGSEGNSGSHHPSVSADGRFVSFYSFASNLVPGDTNGRSDVFVRDRGRPVGIGGLSVVPEGDRLEVSGWARFAGQTLTSAEATGGGAAAAERLGAELAAASMVHRPELDDLFVRLRLTSLPPLPAGAGPGLPGVLYAVGFDLDDVRHEVRTLRLGATVVPPATPYFGLYRCDPDCTEQARLTGGIGTTGTDIVVSVPLAALDVGEGDTLSAVRAFTALGEAAAGPLAVLDDLDLPDATIPGTSVSLGVAPVGAAESDVTFDTAAVSDGRFSVSLDASGLPAADYRVWARACLGGDCGATSTTVSLEAR